MLPRCSLPLFVLAALTAAMSQSSTTPQTAANPTVTFKTRARLVLVDIVVTNSKGEPVTALKKEDFEVFEDGKPQAISLFEEHKDTRLTPVKLPPMPSNVYTNFPAVQAADSVDVLLLDALNTPMSDQGNVRTQMVKYLKTIPPRTRVAVFTLASRLRMLQGVTSDSSQLLAALSSAIAGLSPSPLRASTIENDANQRRVEFLTAESAQPANQAQYTIDPISATKEFMSDTARFETDSRVRMTLEAMRQLARYLADIPGRKNVIWFSGSFPPGIVPDSDSSDPFRNIANFQEQIRQTTDYLTTAQVALYPIAAEGLVSETAFQVDNREISQQRSSIAAQDTMQQSRAATLDLNASHASMDQLARDTGGRAFYNTNDLSDALSRVVNNGSRYYSLAYSPANANMDGKYRHILVKLVDRKETLAYRRGYYADDIHAALSSGQKPGSDPLMPLMARNLPDYSQILYKVLVQPTKPQPAADAPRAGSNMDMKGPFTRYGVDFAVTADDLRIEAGADGVYHGNIEVMLIAYDQGGKPLNLVVNRSEIRVPEKDLPSLRRGGLQVHREIDIPTGYAFLRTGVYDLNSASAGTLGIPLTVTPTAP